MTSIIEEDFEQLTKIVESQDTKECLGKIKQIVKPLIRKRAGIKRLITLALNKFSDILSDSFKAQQILELKDKLKEIETLDSQIIEAYEQTGIFDIQEDVYDTELAKQCDYHFEMKLQLSELSNEVEVRKSVDETGNLDPNKGSNLLQAKHARVHEVRLVPFAGSQEDVLAFSDFMRQFNDLIGDREEYSSTAKLIYLKSYLKGGALDIIKHLSNEDANYQIALEFLKIEYLDQEVIVDKHINKLVNLKSPQNNDLDALRDFFNVARSSVYELKNFGFNALEEDSLGSKILSYILCDKLPRNFKWKLGILLNTDYPSVAQLLNSYNEIIKSLQKTSEPKRLRNENVTENKSKIKFAGSSNNSSNFNQFQRSSVWRNKEGQPPNYGFNHNFNKFENKSYNSNLTKPSASLQNFKTQVKTEHKIGKACKLCGESHSMLKCEKFSSPSLKIERLQQLGLCSYCSGNHANDKCVGLENKLTFPCTICGSRAHIAAVCKEFPTKQHNLCLLNNSLSRNGSAILPSISTIVHDNGNNVKLIRCMVDPCSQSSYISESLKRHMGFEQLPTFTCSIKTFMGTCVKTYEVANLDMHITPQIKINADFLVDKDFNVDYKIDGIQLAIDNLKKSGYTFADSFFNNISSDTLSGFDCLIGADLLEFLKPMQTSDVETGTAYLVQDGLILFGPVTGYLKRDQVVNELEAEYYQLSDGFNDDKMINLILNPNDSYFNPINYAKNDCSIDMQVEDLFKVESLGIKSNNADLSQEEDSMVSEFDKSITFDKGHYNVVLPFKENIAQVPSNWSVALKTLFRVYESLKKKGLVSEYNSVFRQQLENGIIEQVYIPKEDYDKYTFIPHHPVIKTENQVVTKLRVVYNASLKTSKDAPSLNQACFEGLDLINNLVKLLIKFRQNKYVLLADIEKAYLMIKLKLESDRNHFCFFWLDNGKLVTYRYQTIIFGLNVSPFVLHRVMSHHLDQYDLSEAVRALKTSFYVDNFVYTTSNLETLSEVFCQSRQIMGEGGFNLRCFVTNFEPLEVEFRKQNVAVQHSEPVEKLLGYLYNPKKDTLSLSDFKIPNVDFITKRHLLGHINRVFDPLSLMLPVTIRSRLLMKTVWSEKTDWDERISPDSFKAWNSLVIDLLELKRLEVPRITVDSAVGKSVRLDTFCDGSKSCFGFCSYITVEHKSSKLVFAKGRITPDDRSIPQTELLSVFLSLKCLPLVFESFNNLSLTEINIWTDAQIVLEWLFGGGQSNKNKFTKNRISDILKMKLEMESSYHVKINFKYVKSEENPADLITRGLKVQDFLKRQQFWFNGPCWLNNKLSWPVHELKCLSESSQKIIRTHCNISTKESVPELIIDPSRFSTLNKLLRVTEYVFKFINKMLKRKSDPYKDGKLYLVNSMQRQCFPIEYKYLVGSNLQTGAGSKSTVPSLVNDLNLFLDSNGTIRCKGRISKLNYYCYNVLHPFLLARTHHLTYLLVLDAHLRSKHLGVGTTLMHLRESGFWLPSGRQAVKTMIKDCITCKKLNCFSFNYPKLTNLPKERINLVKPFNHTGIDYTAHIWVKMSDGQVGKMYIVLYTCLALRSIHVDLVPDLTLSSFLQSFKRFCNCYGIPESIYTDNASYFEASKSYLSQALESNEFQDHLNFLSITHKNIPAYASWVGGVYERQIKTVKQCLYKSVGRAKLGYFELLTVLSDIQNSINNRPITYVHSEINEIEALTPNKILKLHSNPRLQLVDDEVDSDSLWTPSAEVNKMHDGLNKTLSCQKKVFEDYKRQWYGHYLLGLRETNKDLYQSNWEDRLAVGDIVLVDTQTKPRIHWLMGRVLTLIYGDDGRVRSVLLKMPNKDQAHYSVKHLYPLEIQATHLGNRQDHQKGVNSAELSNLSVRPKLRKAAAKCNEAIQAQMAGNLV